MFRGNFREIYLLCFGRLRYLKDGKGSQQCLDSQRKQRFLVQSIQLLHFLLSIPLILLLQIFPLFQCHNQPYSYASISLQTPLNSDSKHRAYIQYYMTKRALPQRSTRGQLPPHLREEPQPIKSLKNQPENQQDRLRKENEAKKRMSQLLNLKKYPYMRALHYFINLDELPRVAETVSYVYSENIYLRHTYSKDAQMIKGSKIGDLLNRSLIGLPCNLSGELALRKQNRCKNVCYGYLFEIQDKKHNNDRIILTIKTILKKIHTMSSPQLSRYDFFKKDSQLQEILCDDMDVETKRQILQEKMETLQLKKQTNGLNWQFDDTVLYYHSLNQRFHNSVSQLKNKLSEAYFYQLLEDYAKRENDFALSLITTQDYLHKTLRYYHSNAPVLSPSTLKNITLSTQAQKSPFLILHIAQREQLYNFTQFLLSRRAFSMGQVHFYEVKRMVKKIFRRDLKLKGEKMVNYEIYYKNFRKRYEQIKKFKKGKGQKTAEQSRPPLLDDRLKCSSQTLFKLSESVELIKKEFVFLMIYFWLAQSLANLAPYFAQFPDLLEMISSDFYPKVCNPLVQAIGIPSSGFILYIFEALTDLMSKAEVLANANARFTLEYDEKTNACMIWIEQAGNQADMPIDRYQEKGSNKKIKQY